MADQPVSLVPAQPGSEPVDNSKHIILSKTLWVNVILALTAVFVPSVHEYLVKNPDIAVYLLSGVNVLLRLFTKGAVTFG